MPTNVKILTTNEIKSFDSPPEFNHEERKIFFDLPEWTNNLINSFRTSTNKVGFVLQLGYFKAVNRFFDSKNFELKDIEFISKKLSISSEEIDLKKYSYTSFERHQDIILNSIGFRKFDEKSKSLIMHEAFNLCKKHMKPRLIFMSLIDFFKLNRIQGVSYFVMAEIITNALNRFEKQLVSIINRNISNEQRELLDELLRYSEEYQSEKK